MSIGIGISDTKWCRCKVQRHYLATSILLIPVAIVNWIPQLLGKVTSCQLSVISGKARRKLEGPRQVTGYCRGRARESVCVWGKVRDDVWEAWWLEVGVQVGEPLHCAQSGCKDATQVKEGMRDCMRWCAQVSEGVPEASHRSSCVCWYPWEALHRSGWVHRNTRVYARAATWIREVMWGAQEVLCGLRRVHEDVWDALHRSRVHGVAWMASAVWMQRGWVVCVGGDLPTSDLPSSLPIFSVTF